LLPPPEVRQRGTLAYDAGRCPWTTNATVELTDENFDAEIADGPVVVDFWAEWCGPCRVLSPTIDELAEDFRGRVKVGKLNTDRSPETARRFDVRSIPMVVLFKGGRKVSAFVGVRPKAELSEAIEALVD